MQDMFIKYYQVFFSGRNNKYFQNTQVFSEVSDKKNLDFTASLDWTSLV